MQLVPIEWTSQTISGISGSISIACWVIVFVPQIYENFYRKSADGLSQLFVVLWLAGDVFNLVGALMQKLLSTMIILAAYYTAADIVLLLQCLWYGPEEKVDPIHLSPANPINENVLQDVFHENQPLLQAQSPTAGLVATADDLLNPEVEVKKNYLHDGVIVSVVIMAGFLSWYISYCQNPGLSKPDGPSLEVNWLGQIFGYLSALLYLGSRVPQILLNFERKSCEGISFLFFLFACLGNSSFILSVLAISLDRKYLILNASWLIGSIGTLAMDFVIFAQFFAYHREIKTVDQDSV
ncbi:hypothetical protein HG537_0D02660 [Torulaspora globosa]|uniref:PQ-loop-domain-containing protein n=1 Tax=Torulaspora globosa TaxID=48254 RepID=A0A7H9HUZ7_9SACH|nr:hypothetical protein HG537_0D02660 [Torulaspora sp. CBS 2947]